MADRPTNIRKSAFGTARRLLGAAFGQNGNGHYGELLVCQLRPGAVVGTHVTRRGEKLDSRRVTLRAKKDGAAFLGRAGGRCGVALLLPKRHYLIRVLEIPDVKPEEAETMLRLEAEAVLPPDLGEVEISYRRLTAAREKHQKYEVYVARAEVIAAGIADLAAVGLRADLILPGAVVWSLLMARAAGAALLVSAGDGAEQMEIASLEPQDGSLFVRTIESLPAEEGAGLEPGLVETLRSLLMSARPEKLPLVVGWIGDRRPASFDKVSFDEIGSLFPETRWAAGGGGHGDGGAGGNGDGGAGNGGAGGAVAGEEAGRPFLDLGAVALLDSAEPRACLCANLVPRELVARREHGAALKSIAAGAALVLAAGLVVYAAVELSAFRYRRVAEELAAQAAAIQAEGETVGRQREQLKVAKAAIATRNDLADVVRGLYEGTLAGVTYSQVDLDAAGKLKLRGQSESLAAAFLLPESLGKQPMFTKVQLLDAGQVTRGAGAVTEFRIECRYVRPEVRP